MLSPNRLEGPVTTDAGSPRNASLVESVWTSAAIASPELLATSLVSVVWLIREADGDVLSLQAPRARRPAAAQRWTIVRLFIAAPSSCWRTANATLGGASWEVLSCSQTDTPAPC